MPKWRLIIQILLTMLLIMAVNAASTSMNMLNFNDNSSSLPTISTTNAYAKEELIVAFNTPQNDYTISKKTEHFPPKLSNKHTIKRDYSPYGLANTYLVGLSAGESVESAQQNYTSDPDVIYAEPNYIVTISQIPNDPSFSQLWGLHNSADTDIDAPEAWDTQTGSYNVVIAVVDTGVDYTHPDLAANIWTNQDELPGNSLDDDGNGYIDDVYGWDFRNNDNSPMDDHGHGTHCAGTIGAVGSNGIGVTGVMWKTKIMPLKFMSSSGSGYTADAMNAILYANRNGAHVISNSWGGSGASTALKNAIDASPAVVVCAAGNDNKNIDSSPMYPASYTSSQIISVAATTSADARASYSNYGPKSVDVGAPGSSIYSTLRGGKYGSMSGTSMAAPHVAGLAGLIKAQNPGMTNLEIKDTILSNIDIVSGLTGKVLTSGRINAYKSLSSLQPAGISITGITPSSVVAGSPGFIMTVNGSDFISVSVVNWNGNPRETEFISSSCLKTPVGSAELISPSVVMITVTDSESGTSNAREFTIVSPSPPPLIRSISQSYAQLGASKTVYVYGSNFVPGAAFELRKTGSSPIAGSSVLVRNPGYLSARITILSTTVKGYWDVVVINPDGQNGTRAASFRIY